jgi:hypothetical protein
MLFQNDSSCRGGEMKRILFVVLALAVISFVSVSVHAATDFTGTWVLDINKSDLGMNNPAAKAKAKKVVLILKQTATKLTIERSTGDVATYNLDGSESVNTLPGGGKSKTTVKWIGDKLVGKTVSSAGATMTDERSLSANGKEMVVKVSMQMPSGERKQTLIYNKK